VIAEVGVHALEANDAAAVDDHEAHLGYAAHHAHWFVWLGKHVVGTGDLEVSVEENGQRAQSIASNVANPLVCRC
jgi:hypothetical protein